MDVALAARGDRGEEPRIVLGSSSRGRRQCLAAAGYAFEIMVPDINEKAVAPLGADSRHTADPAALTLAIAHAKADALLPRLQGQDRLLITSDQVVHYNGHIREKPESTEECRAYLKSYEQAPACTVSAVVVTHTASGRRVDGVDVARQWFKPIPDEVVDALLAKGDVMYCCGGFLIDDELLAPHLGPREGEAESIIGLPMTLTRRLLDEVERVPATDG